MNGPEAIRDDVVAAVREIVTGEMGSFGLRDVRVRASEDHDGDPILLIEAEYGPEGEPVEPKVIAGLATKLRDRLWDMGETRFPHVRHHFAEQQKIAGYS